MGCGVSRINGNGMALRARLRPVVPDISILRRNRATKNYSTTSVKKLLSRNSTSSDGTKTAPSSLEDSVNDRRSFPEPQQKEAGKPTDGAPVKENGITTGIGNEGYTSEDVFTDAECGEDEEVKNDRMIGHRAFMGSPSFRIYYKDSGEDEHDDDSFEDAIPCDHDDVSQKETSVSEEKKPVRSRDKRRSFTKVFPKGKHVKRLLTAKSCYFPIYSRHDRTHLLKGKTVA